MWVSGLVASSVQHVAGHIMGAINISQKFQLASVDPRLGLSQSSYIWTSPALEGDGGHWEYIKEWEGNYSSLSLWKTIKWVRNCANCWPKENAGPDTVPSSPGPFWLFGVSLFLLPPHSFPYIPERGGNSDRIQCLTLISQQCQEKVSLGFSLFIWCLFIFFHSLLKAHHGWLNHRKYLYKVVFATMALEFNQTSG